MFDNLRDKLQNLKLVAKATNLVSGLHLSAEDKDSVRQLLMAVVDRKIKDPEDLKGKIMTQKWFTKLPNDLQTRLLEGTTFLVSDKARPILDTVFPLLKK